MKILGVYDSKAIDEPTRELLFEELTSNPEVLFAVSVVDNRVIDRINILQATYKAMTEAVLSLSQRPEFVFIDGNRLPPVLAVRIIFTTSHVIVISFLFW